LSLRRWWLAIILLILVVRLSAAEDLVSLEQKAFRAAVDRVAPSVVRIETIGGLERIGRVLFGTGPTTGVVVAPDGYIVSSAFNFIHRPASILVQLPDGTRKPARLVATDQNRMLALLKIEADRPLPVPESVPESELRVGQWAIAVGRAFEVNQPNMAVGVVSALERIWGKAIQTDAAVSPNNYGGPLLDIRGRVMGVLVPLSPQDTSEIAGYEWYDSGIGFAIPFRKIQEILPRLKQGKDLRPGLLGINFAGTALFLADPIIAVCRPRSPARQAGFKAGDRIAAIDGRKVDLAAQAKQEIAVHYAGDRIRLAVLRDGKRIENEVQLVAKLEPFQPPFLGILPMRIQTKPRAKPQATAAKAVTEKPREKAAGEPTAGVAVRYVYPEGPAAKAGLQRGDVLSTFAGAALNNAGQLRAMLADCEPEQKVPLEFRRGGETQKVEVALQTLPEAIPSGDLSTAREPVPPDGNKKPKTGLQDLKLPDFPDRKIRLYVPEGYDARASYGLVVWLHGSAAPDEKAWQDWITPWKPLCDRGDLILAAPQSAEKGNWHEGDLRMLHRLLAHVASNYALDPSRIVAAGREGGGTMAFGLAFTARGAIQAVAAVDAGFAGPVPENEPGRRLAFYIARSRATKSAGAVKGTVSRLREMKYPVTIKELGPDSRDLAPEELAELARWIDSLDRI
jgi:serine protease Do